MEPPPRSPTAQGLALSEWARCSKIRRRCANEKTVASREKPGKCFHYLPVVPHSKLSTFFISQGARREATRVSGGAPSLHRGDALASHHVSHRGEGMRLPACVSDGLPPAARRRALRPPPPPSPAPRLHGSTAHVPSLSAKRKNESKRNTRCVRHCVPPAAASRSPHRWVCVHLGVHTGASCINLEQRAANEAAFRFPDEAGWQPAGEAVQKNDAGTGCRDTALPVDVRPSARRRRNPPNHLRAC